MDLALQHSRHEFRGTCSPVGLGVRGAAPTPAALVLRLGSSANTADLRVVFAWGLGGSGEDNMHKQLDELHALIMQ